MPTKTKKSAKSFFDLTSEERDHEVERFEKPIDLERDTRPLTPKQRAMFERARDDKPDVSVRIHDGRRDVIIYLDDELMARAKAYARKNKTTLPKMIDRGLRGLLSFFDH